MLTSILFSIIVSVSRFPPGDSSEEARLPSLSPDRFTSPLAGQVVVFTGKLSSLGRKEARAVVERLGGITADEVSAKTTMLVIGSEGFGPSSAEAPEKSNKLRRAEELNAQPGRRAGADPDRERGGILRARRRRDRRHA
jgi:NAD-dependent DNA ligase